ncbi:PREDICTED: uncharacterized protein LOC109586489 [Amphimedon queenslandica]|uniref:Tyr recombinase domain-containing protein n=1 Tax=Amphimedon queenslandica TaxID=400682 RepID=A0AAN0JML4_AMPQE|nr:PREDICTED: uncharacterized protein LOC109586489 [Amphimedon queenslandica]|eukprot:XP_019858244.1 PREDICTED: uncharacterized protein LOC109586489 [Amphimedon queenslandica]
MSGKSFKKRAEHKGPVIGESLYLWAGNQVDLPKVHDSLQKKELTSRVDVYQLSTADWSSHLTRGTPPLGVMAYSCTTSHSNIYYFGGWCGHDICYHNTLNVLNTIKMEWTSCSNAEQSLMKKSNAGMISLEFDGAEYLVIIGGKGSTPTVYHPQFLYDQLNNGRIRTNEQLLYNVSTGQFTVPSVSGQCCPPTDAFIIEKITTTGNRGVMFGGAVTVNGDESTSTNSVYIFSVTHSIINWEILKPGAIPNEGLWPIERDAHASAIINGDSISPTLVVIGGRDKRDQLVNGERYPPSSIRSLLSGIGRELADNKVPFNILDGNDLHFQDDLNRTLDTINGELHCDGVGVTVKKAEVISKELEQSCWDALKRFVSLITGLSEYTNHSLRATAVSRMYNSGVPEKIISDKSGHRSLEALRLYERPEEDLYKEAEQAIVDPDKKFLNDVKVKSEDKTEEAVPLPQLPAFSGLNQFKGDDSNDIMSSVLEEMRQEQERLIEEKQIITG